MSAAAITGVGAVTPVGLAAAPTCAALRAGVARLRELPGLAVGGQGVDVALAVGGRVPLELFAGEPPREDWAGHERFGLEPPPPPELLVEPGPERLVRLAIPAAQEAWSTAKPFNGSDRIGLYLGLDYLDHPTALLPALAAALRVSFHPTVVIAGGRAAVLVALETALAHLSSGQVTAALVGGVDSLIRAPVLARLEAEGSLKTDTNPHGVMPGEGAGFLLLEPQGRALHPLAWVLSTVSTKEPSAGTDEPNQAAGLTDALRGARDLAGGLSAPPLVVCDLNGDRYRALEWAMASLRTLGHLHGDADIWHPADCIGDTGAASGAINLIWAATALGAGYAAAERVVVWGASQGKARAAAVLAPPVR